jgi:hypothetical protein
MLTQTVLTTLSETTSTPTIQPPADASLEDLRQLQRDWLEEARQAGHLAACRIIARTLGEQYQLRYRREIDARRWQSGALKIECWQWSGNYQPHRHDYTRKSLLTVYYGDLTVCNHLETTGINKHEDHFIPGPWTDELAAPLALAQQTIADQEAAALEQQRQELLARLLGS